MEEADALCGRIGIMARGTLRVIGTNLHLKNKFGSGYKLEIICEASAAKQAQAEAFIARICPTATLSSGFGDQRLFQVPKAGVKMSELFTAMIKEAAPNGIADWGIHQTSLEEVFIKIAAASEAGADPRGLS